MRVERKLLLGYIFAALVMIATAGMPFLTVRAVTRMQANMDSSQQRNDLLDELLSVMQDVETGARGFVITGREEFLEPYHESVARLKALRSSLPSQDWAADRRNAQTSASLFPLAEAKLANEARAIDIRRTEGADTAAAYVGSGQGKASMDRLRYVVAQMRGAESAEHLRLETDAVHLAENSILLGAAATLLDLALIAFLLWLQFGLMRERQASARQLQKANDELAASSVELERRHAEVKLIGQMARALESPGSLKETLETTAIYCARLLPGTAGALYLFRNSRDLLVQEAHWRTPRSSVDAMAPADCWALRRGQPHLTESAEDLACPHLREAAAIVPGTLCVPLVAQGEVLGLVSMEPEAGAGHGLEANRQALALAACEQIALTLTNVKLREALRQQSVVDPLTGLFNRRYMDETLRRELARAARREQPVSVIVLDVDHFKRVNDAFGHDGGDIVLRAVANQLRADVRESDVACRLGGEEFLLVLADCAKDEAVRRTELIAAHLRLLDVQYGGQQIGRVTASFGVAAWPEDAHDAGELVKCADRAMYAAKNGGRDRVVAA